MPLKAENEEREKKNKTKHSRADPSLGSGSQALLSGKSLLIICGRKGTFFSRLKAY